MKEPADLFVWSDVYAVRVVLIDTQHQQLVAMLNELHAAMVDGQTRTVVRGVLERLLAYTDYHFRAEEELMREHSYPGYAAHQDEHDALLQKVLSLDADSRAGKLTVPVELSLFLRNWLQKHITVVDKKLGAFLNLKGVR